MFKLIGEIRIAGHSRSKLHFHGVIFRITIIFVASHTPCTTLTQPARLIRGMDILRQQNPI